MPNETFYNLSEEKRQRIINSAIHEFKLHPLHKCRISNIIKQADIPRGSFYQYFDSLEDLYFYVIDLSFTNLFDEGRRIAKETDDLFEFIERTFKVDYDGYFKTKDHLFLMHLLQNAQSNEAYFDKRKVEHREYVIEILNHLDLSKYKDMSFEEFIKFYELLQSIKRHTIHQAKHKELDFSQALEALRWKLDIIKHGVLK
ncbi:MAG: TetR family transcriptional regulator [Candidatus Izemoplasma sp.]|nr:TetR family transcriptional regulator [Candidatus Izemoplasma sp.]